MSLEPFYPGRATLLPEVHPGQKKAVDPYFVRALYDINVLLSIKRNNMESGNLTQLTFRSDLTTSLESFGPIILILSFI